jgi:hypothetical protein
VVADGAQAPGDLDLVTATSRFLAIERVHLAAALAEVLAPLADWSVPSLEAELNDLDSARWTELAGRARPPGRDETFTERLRSERRDPVRPRHTQTLRAQRAGRYCIGWRLSGKGSAVLKPPTGDREPGAGAAIAALRISFARRSS